MSRHCNSGKCNNPLIVVVGRGPVKVKGVDFETWIIVGEVEEEGVEDR